MDHRRRPSRAVLRPALDESVVRDGLLCPLLPFAKCIHAIRELSNDFRSRPVFRDQLRRGSFSRMFKHSNQVMQHLPSIGVSIVFGVPIDSAIGALGPLEPGLRIAKVFRNKEGHVVVRAHNFDAQEYREIETALVGVYAPGFGQT